SLQRMIGEPNPPTAIMCHFDDLAEMIYFQLDRLDLRVPEDISLIGFGGTWRRGALARRLTSVVVDEAELGSRAANLLNEMRCGLRNMDDSEEFVMPLGLHEGETVGRAASQSECGKSLGRLSYTTKQQHPREGDDGSRSQ
ncbi:MAG: substrate-binding domain-containing protein, partial [Pirellulales bacterium]|nr:substrate-binding domain-containing protein [Pirellulales bacterium]